MHLYQISVVRNQAGLLHFAVWTSQYAQCKCNRFDQSFNWRVQQAQEAAAKRSAMPWNHEDILKASANRTDQS